MQKMLFLLFIVATLFGSCEMRNHIVTKYCGFVMTPNEVVEIVTKGKGFKYSDKDMEIHSEIATFAQKIGGDSLIVEVFFFLSNKNELGIFLYGPENEAIIEKMNCAIIKSKYKNSVPSKKYILYYNENEEGSLLSAIKSEI